MVWFHQGTYHLLSLFRLAHHLRRTVPQYSPAISLQEQSIYVLFVMALTTKYRKAITTEAFAYDIVSYIRIAILALCFFGNSRALSWFMIAFIVFGFMLKKEPYRGPTKVITITETSLKDVVLDDFTDKVHLVLVHDPHSTRCKFFLRDFATLSLRFTSPALRFYTLDATRAPETMRKYNIRPNQRLVLPPTVPIFSTLVNAMGLEIASEQLPTVLCFRRGALVTEGQLPLLESVKKVRQLSFANIVKYFGIKDVLDASDVLIKVKGEASSQQSKETRVEKKSKNKMNKHT